MIFDVFKLVVWLIERYNLQDKVVDNFSDYTSNEPEAIMVEPHKPYLMHFDEPAISQEDLMDKMIECTQ
jgi:hypothetical protein